MSRGCSRTRQDMPGEARKRRWPAVSGVAGYVTRCRSTGGDPNRRARQNSRMEPALIPTAKSATGKSAVTVVNLFSWRATKPADLKRAASVHDIVGTRTDDVIVEVSGSSPVTLAAWGSHGSFLGRGAAVAALLSRPLCLRRDVQRTTSTSALRCGRNRAPTVRAGRFDKVRVTQAGSAVTGVLDRRVEVDCGEDASDAPTRGWRGSDRPRRRRLTPCGALASIACPTSPIHRSHVRNDGPGLVELQRKPPLNGSRSFARSTWPRPLGPSAHRPDGWAGAQATAIGGAHRCSGCRGIGTTGARRSSVYVDQLRRAVRSEWSGSWLGVGRCPATHSGADGSALVSDPQQRRRVQRPDG